MKCSEIAVLFSDVETIFILGFFFRPSPRRNFCNEFKMSDRKLIVNKQFGYRYLKLTFHIFNILLKYTI